jgi:hypothetical protein
MEIAKSVPPISPEMPEVDFLERHPHTWTAVDTAKWLSSVDFGEYSKAFVGKSGFNFARMHDGLT